MFNSSVPQATVDCISIDMSDMNVYTIRHVFACSDPSDTSHEHGYSTHIDPNATRALLQDKCKLRIEVLRNLQSTLHDIPNMQYVPCLFQCFLTFRFGRV